jgi:hypothetical protein
VNHCHQILATTTGHPARWNDKTLVLFDNFVVSLNERHHLDDVSFGLYESDCDGRIEKVKYIGAWFIVDNGYLNWPVTVPPLKASTSRHEICFSQWLESMQKDVECTFGILKGQFRILKTGIRLHGQESANKRFLTYCALHNWLLHVDGLDVRWEDGVQSDWEGPMGEHSMSNGLDRLPDAITRLLSPAAIRNYDVSEVGCVCPPRHEQVLNDTTLKQKQYERQCEDRAIEGNSVRIVRNMSLQYFRSKLI